MNKKLLTLAAVAAMSVSSISAAEVSLLNDNSFTANDLNVQFSAITPVDGVFTLSITADPAQPYSNQLFITANKELAAGDTYTFAMEAKSTSPRKIEFQAHGEPGTYKHWNIAGGSMEVGADWTKYTFSGEVPAEADGMMTIAISLSTAPEACTMEFKNIAWNLVEEGGDTPEQPEDPKPEQPGEGVVASWYTGNGASFSGWGGSATFEQTTEDDKPCLAITNPAESENPWDVQIGIDVNLENAKTYYLAFDVKGTAAEGITAGIQNSKDYSGKGNFTTFNITENWNRVVISATVNGEDADRITINLGKYVGSFYMTNVVLTTTNPAGLDAVEVAPSVDRWIVYNLMGVKVLDTDNEAALGELANGIYVINGKKVAIRR